MTPKRMLRLGSILAAILLFSTHARTQTNGSSAAPDTQGASVSLPHDSHEGLTISVDPYTDPSRAKQKFEKANPLQAGILPLEVFLHNETNQPIHVALDTIQLEVQFRNGGRQDIDWLSANEVALLIAHPGGPNPGRRRLPIPLSIPVGDKKAEKLAGILKPFTLDADIVPPLGTVHGFLYFNLANDMSLARHSNLYVPDVAQLPANKILMFFDVPLSTAVDP